MIICGERGHYSAYYNWLLPKVKVSDQKLLTGWFSDCSGLMFEQINQVFFFLNVFAMVVFVMLFVAVRVFVGISLLQI